MLSYFFICNIMKFYSQYKQDEFIYNNFFKNKKEPGFFLEIGADDGVRFSNCKFLEDHLKWTGIAIEARQEAYNKLVNNRKCTCLHSILSDVEENTQFLDIKGYGLGLSGLINKYDPRHVKRIAKEVKNPNNKGQKIIDIKTKKLNTILDKYEVKHIDYLSIDTEGSELDILKTLDFNKYYIDIVTIEDNYKDKKIMDFFTSRNYTFISDVGCDKVFKKKVQ